MINYRRFAILALGLITVFLFASFVIAQTGDDSGDLEKLDGSWNVEVTVESQGATFPALITFGADGSIVADEPPLPGETSGHGNWVRNDDGQAAYTFEALYSGDSGEYAGKLKVVGTLQFDASTEAWQGPFKIAVFDADGQATYSDQGTFHLTRISIESMS